MGCDIHAAIEVKDTTGKWTALLHPNKYFGKYSGESELTARVDIGRDYDLFAVLANVRNGTAFAGCVTGTGFDYISEPRGVPDDISDEARGVLSDEHSASWVTLPEILAFDWTKVTTKTGVVTEDEFEKWDRTKEWNPSPSSYSGAVHGQRVRHISPDEMRARIAAKSSGAVQPAGDELLSYYTRIDWREGYANACSQMWTKVLPPMLRAATVCGNAENVRLVMDFDS